jgi:hypothetical protein
MTHSGVGTVVPGMAAANTNASSQNATRREAARRPRQVMGEGLRQSIQAESAIRLELCVALWWRPLLWGSVTVGSCGLPFLFISVGRQQA